VEVAAYRIAAEAVTNAVRHAAAGRVEVRLERTADTLRVRVRDDGVGVAAQARRGVGLGSMRERAAELGGWCTVSPADPGTQVLAVLPTVSDPGPAPGPVPSPVVAGEGA
jgi:signal transduction histidine kinase